MDKQGSERKFENRFYREIRSAGMTRDAGGSSHGLRHSYAQDKYRQMTGVEAPCRHKSKEDFRSAMQEKHGQNWTSIDRDTRLILKSELGHGPDRDDVVSQYVGSS